jgi:hypothetical protein
MAGFPACPGSRPPTQWLPGTARILRAGDAVPLRALQPQGDPDQGDEGWLTLRYRKAYRQQLIPLGFGDIPCLITDAASMD